MNAPKHTPMKTAREREQDRLHEEYSLGEKASVEAFYRVVFVLALLTVLLIVFGERGV